ncbi:hypothetical protein VAEKB19_3200028 [Vibrio aestuarianus]|nr:hypothetical protein VAEKB19_3200028 [Vibrio aestuarianus]
MLRSSSNHGVNGKFDGAHSNQIITKKLAQSIAIAKIIVKMAMIGDKSYEKVNWGAYVSDR